MQLFCHNRTTGNVKTWSLSIYDDTFERKKEILDKRLKIKVNPTIHFGKKEKPNKAQHEPA